jgi:F0F1-type ATP synthase delta subunit
MTATQIIKRKYDIISWITDLEDINLIQDLYRWMAEKEKEEIVQLSTDQVNLLLLSENDIANGRLVSESDLNKTDEQWIF